MKATMFHGSKKSVAPTPEAYHLFGERSEGVLKVAIKP